MRIAIDTNRYSDLSRMLPEVIRFLKDIELIAMRFIVLAELNAGFQAGARREHDESQLDHCLSLANVTALFADGQTVRLYAQLQNQLRRQGTPIPTNDLWIASLATQHGLAINCRDAHFRAISQVSLI